MARSSRSLRVRLSAAARDDIRAALTWSREHFGASAATRYRKLIQQAIVDIAGHDTCPGAEHRPELGAGIWIYHLLFSRERAGAGQGAVRRPRHFLVFRRGRDTIDVVRVLHDARDLARHVPGE